MQLIKYLEHKLKRRTVTTYYNVIKNYLAYTTEEKAAIATYKDVLDYIGILRKKYTNQTSINPILYAIKQYYHWLMDTGQRADHPCKDLKLKDTKSGPIQLQDLYTPQELELLLEIKERYKCTAIKNKVIISLLIYQGLTLSELTALTLKDVDLYKGTIYIKSGAKSNSRTLFFKATQIILISQYLNQTRPQLIKITTDKLLLNIKGKPEDGQGILKLIRKQRYYFPQRILDPMTIRQSVIANLLKEGKDIREVQIFAGHRYPSTTEKYKQNHIEELKAAILKHHPLQ